MTHEVLRQYPLAPIVRREFLKRASLATLLWGANPRAALAQAGAPGSLLIQGGLIVTSERQFLGDIRTRAGKIQQVGSNLAPLSSGEEQVVDARGMLVLPGELTLTPIFQVVSRTWPAAQRQPWRVGSQPSGP